MYRVRWNVARGRPDSRRLYHWELVEHFTNKLVNILYQDQPIMVTVTDNCGVIVYRHERK